MMNSKSPTRPRSSKKAVKRPAAGRTLGPVSDLEQHLPPQWWATLFNSIYIKTDGDVVENRENTVAECDLVEKVAGLGKDARILDLCCGQGRHVLEWARRGYGAVSGIDRSRYLVRLARRRAKQEGLEVSLHEGDARRLPKRLAPLDCVTLMGNSFGYFDRSEEDHEVLRAVLRVLAPGGVVVLDLADGDWQREHFEPRSWEWIDQEHMVCRERSLSADGQRLVSREVVVHAERGVLVDQFYAERLYSFDQIRTLLEEAGFEVVTDHGSLQPLSDRGQDLGMMAHRLLVSARAPRVPAAAAVAPATRRVTVLLGDPRLPDAVKREGHFAPEDLETVARLKRALGELPGFEFQYLDDHSTWLDALRAETPDLVFNLCDEGYRNDPFRELHVPALLEMLEIPYTGSGPATLGLCYDKALVRVLAESLSIPVPLESYMRLGDQSATLPSIFPALVKPNFGDSSMGITQGAVVHSPQELVEYRRKLDLTLPPGPILVQEFLSGDEYSVGVVGNPGFGARVLPVLAVDYSRLDPELPRILGYESKWDPDSPYWKDIRYVPAKGSEAMLARLQEYSLLLFERLGCHDYARFDYRADAGGEVKLLEVNPNPGWCWDGKLNLMAELAGWSYPKLLGRILEGALERKADAAIRRAQSASITH
jgi:D-alanine-D-alanine ligase